MQGKRQGGGTGSVCSAQKSDSPKAPLLSAGPSEGEQGMWTSGLLEHLTTTHCDSHLLTPSLPFDI